MIGNPMLKALLTTATAALLTLSVGAHATAETSSPPEFLAPAGYRLTAEVMQLETDLVVHGRVCRVQGAAGRRPQTVRIFAVAAQGHERLIGWAGLSRTASPRSTGCAWFTYRTAAPDAPALRLIAS